jgi:hypothetical protein
MFRIYQPRDKAGFGGQNHRQINIDQKSRQAKVDVGNQNPPQSAPQQHRRL